MQENLNSRDISPEQDKTFLSRVYRRSLDSLKKYYGVDDLSPIEASRLRQIIKETIKEEADYEKAVGSGELEGTQEFSYRAEIPARWLFELYGIKPEDIPSDYKVGDKEIFPDKGRAMNRLNELKYQGQLPFLQQIPTAEFKKHLKKIREEAHQSWG